MKGCVVEVHIATFIFSTCHLLISESDVSRPYVHRDISLVEGLYLKLFKSATMHE